MRTRSIRNRMARCVTCSEEHRLRVLGCEGDEATVEWRRLHAEPHDQYSAPKLRVIRPRRMRWKRRVCRIRET